MPTVDAEEDVIAVTEEGIAENVKLDSRAMKTLTKLTRTILQ